MSRAGRVSGARPARIDPAARGAVCYPAVMSDPADSGQKRVRAVISGRVQGVWFRAWTEEEARRRGLDGWVMNRRDGAVEAVFQGDASRVDDMLEACWHGPSHARVIDVAAQPEPGPVAPGFHVRSSRGE